MSLHSCCEMHVMQCMTYFFCLSSPKSFSNLPFSIVQPFFYFKCVSKDLTERFVFLTDSFTMWHHIGTGIAAGCYLYLLCKRKAYQVLCLYDDRPEDLIVVSSTAYKITDSYQRRNPHRIALCEH